MKSSTKKILITFAVIGISVFVLFFYKCPIKLIFGFDCPGCGLTRALKSLLMLDFRSAFDYHPMIFIFSAEFLYFIFSRFIIKKRFKEKTEQLFLILTIILTIIVWILRMFFN